jgi:hypothetical protein
VARGAWPGLGPALLKEKAQADNLVDCVWASSDKARPTAVLAGTGTFELVCGSTKNNCMLRHL